jgi:hypothetical protein
MIGVGRTEIRIKGRNTSVPSVQIGDKNVITSGKFLKVAVIQDEDVAEFEPIADPEAFVSRLKSSGLRADIFTFCQRLPETAPKFTYRMDWDNIAVIPITTYTEWWDKRTDTGTRRAVRKSAKAGVVARVAEFDDAFVQGVMGINNEAPIRQGRPFWHYGKSFEQVRDENSTYAERNVFLGAYLEGEMIGFMRLTLVGKTASILQVLSMMKHYDKRPANAMIAKAVEVAEQLGMSNLMYCNYVYNNLENTLTEFKRRNGFEKVLLPRYYIPLTLRGKLALSLGLHKRIVERIPTPLLKRLLEVRRRWYARKDKATEGSQQD